MPIATAPKKELELKSITRDHLELFEGDLSYNLLKGGTAKSFRSTGIDDRSSNTMLVLEDWGTTLAGKLKTAEIETTNLTAKSLTVDNFKVNGVLETKVRVTSYEVDSRDIVVSAGARTRESLHNSGIYWGAQGPRITFDRFKDKLTVTSGIDLEAGTELTINGKQVLTETALGKNIKSSGLTKLGILEELNVAGDAGVETLYASGIVIGLDSESKMAITATEDQISWGLGEFKDQLVLRVDQAKGIALYQADELVVTFDSDVTVLESDLMAAKNVKVEKDIAVQGNVGIGKTLYVGTGASITNDGAAKFKSIQLGDNKISWQPVKPEFGRFSRGDIVYNSEPAVGQPAGWICIESGEPGRWATLALAI